MNLKKINFREKKYILPLILLPFVLLIGSQIISFFSEDNKEPIQAELDTGLGGTQDSIMSKNEAYDMYYGQGDNRTMHGGLLEEQDSLMKYGDNLSWAEKRKIDSLNYVNSQLNKEMQNTFGGSYYTPSSSSSSSKSIDEDYQRSMDIVKMLNQGGNNSSSSYYGGNSMGNSTPKEEEKEKTPAQLLKEQMLVLDSIEKSKDPDYQAKLQSQERLKKNRKKMEAFLNNTLKVQKSGLNPAFNSITNIKSDQFIKAIIDENITGYLGSRIRFRLLEDIVVGKKYKIPKGTILYGQISGFESQRVKLNIVSVVYMGDVLPINLSVYDVDASQGLYVPDSMFREMLRELGSNSVQGTQMDSSGEGFFTSMLSKAFTSTSQTIVNLIRKNKAKLKYNSYVYLINDQELNEKYKSE